MTIIINNKDGLKQVSKFSENKIKHITETNQWGYVIDTILKNSNKESMKQTTVEWLQDELNQIKSSSTDMNGIIRFFETEFNKVIEKAKEMEMDQTKEAFDDGFQNKCDADIYFNKKFKPDYKNEN
jgi:GTPase involved in cell partitioning and DNA repair